MFPTLEFKVHGLKPEATYNMYVDMVLVDVNHWKFNDGKWIPSGQAEQSQKTSKYITVDHFSISKIFFLIQIKFIFIQIHRTAVLIG